MAPEDADSELMLQPEAAAAGADVAKVERVKKDHDYRHYVAVYGKEVRTIKWWVQKGRAAKDGPDLPPLDKPVEMPVWWRRVMKQRCPESVEMAARQACGVDHASSQPPEGASAGSDASAPKPPARIVPFEVGAVTTQDENLQHLREQLARCRAELLELQNADEPDQAKIETKEKKWRDLRTEVDKAEEVVFRMRSKQGKLVDIEVLAAELQPMLVTVASAVRGLVTKMKARLAGMNTDEERDAAWNAGVDECFGELVGAGFITREQLALAA